MKIKIIELVIILFATAHIIGAAGMKRERYIPYEATPDEVAVTKVAKKVVCDRAFEQPKNEVFRKHLEKALEMAENEENRIRYMWETGMVRTSYWNGSYGGSVIVRPEKAVYRFSLGGTGKKIGQINKTVYEDQPYGKIKKQSECYFFVFHSDIDSVMDFGYGENPSTIALSFYPSNRLKSCGLMIDGQYYRARWDKDGKLVEIKLPAGAKSTEEEKSGVKTNSSGNTGKP